MLHPFNGHLLGGPMPVTSALAATRSRRVREAARRYQPAEILRQAVASGLYTAASRPRLYGYRIVTPSRAVIQGIVGEVPVSDLLSHEETRGSLVEPAPAVEIRPILVVTEGATPDLAESGAPTVVTEGHRRHIVTPLAVAPPQFEGERLVIADGHHRVRAATQTWGPRGRIMALVVGNSGEGLSVGTFHRRFEGVGELPDEVSGVFEVKPTDGCHPVDGALVWVQGSGDRFLLRPLPEALEAVPEPLRGSGAAVAASALYPLLDVDESHARYAATVDEAVSGMGRGDSALLLPSVPMATVLAAAVSGDPFPPKGTRFSPKPVRGAVLRVADAG
jgi:hypothetical protein